MRPAARVPSPIIRSRSWRNCITFCARPASVRRTVSITAGQLRTRARNASPGIRSTRAGPWASARCPVGAPVKSEISPSKAPGASRSAATSWAPSVLTMTSSPSSSTQTDAVVSRSPKSASPAPRRTSEAAASSASSSDSEQMRNRSIGRRAAWSISPPSGSGG